MPASERRKGPAAAGDTPAVLLDRLDDVVSRLVESFESVRRKAEATEDAYRKLTDALRQSRLDPLDARDLESRVEGLAEENRRLAAVIEEARKRADRIRRRLVVVEDEL